VNLYLLEQSVNTGYDTYSDCVVAADTDEEARLIRPDYQDWNDDTFSLSFSGWVARPEQVQVTFIGIAHPANVKKGIVCKSFHAG